MRGRLSALTLGVTLTVVAAGCGEEASPTGSPSAAPAVAFEAGDCDRLDPATVAAVLGVDGAAGFGGDRASELSTSESLSCTAIWRATDDPFTQVDLTMQVQRFDDQAAADQAWAEAERQVSLGGGTLGVPDDAVLSVEEPEGGWDDAVVVTSFEEESIRQPGGSNVDFDVVRSRMWVRSGQMAAQVTIAHRISPELAPGRDDQAAAVQEAAGEVLQRSLDRL